MLQEADNVLFVTTKLHEKRQRYAELCMLPIVLLALRTAPDCTGVSTGGDPRWDGTDWHDVSEIHFTIAKDQLANMTVTNFTNLMNVMSPASQFLSYFLSFSLFFCFCFFQSTSWMFSHLLHSTACLYVHLAVRTVWRINHTDRR